MRNIEQILRKCENCKLNECDGCITYSDMQVIKARIKELEEELYSANKIINEYLDGIPRQKIEDKIKEIKEDKESKYYYIFLESRDMENTINILEELLEEGE